MVIWRITNVEEYRPHSLLEEPLVQWSRITLPNAPRFVEFAHVHYSHEARENFDWSGASTGTWAGYVKALKTYDYSKHFCVWTSKKRKNEIGNPVYRHKSKIIDGNVLYVYCFWLPKTSVIVNSCLHRVIVNFINVVSMTWTPIDSADVNDVSNVWHDQSLGKHNISAIYAIVIYINCNAVVDVFRKIYSTILSQLGMTDVSSRVVFDSRLMILVHCSS